MKLTFRQGTRARCTCEAPVQIGTERGRVHGGDDRHGFSHRSSSGGKPRRHPGQRMTSRIRLAHFAAGIVFTVIFIWRLYWGIVGNKYSRMILVPPLWSLKWWKMLFEQVRSTPVPEKKPPPSTPVTTRLLSAPCSSCSLWVAS